MLIGFREIFFVISSRATNYNFSLKLTGRMNSSDLGTFSTETFNSLALCGCMEIEALYAIMAGALALGLFSMSPQGLLSS